MILVKHAKMETEPEATVELTQNSPKASPTRDALRLTQGGVTTDYQADDTIDFGWLGKLPAWGFVTTGIIEWGLRIDSPEADAAWRFCREFAPLGTFHVQQEARKRAWYLDALVTRILDKVRSAKAILVVGPALNPDGRKNAVGTLDEILAMDPKREST